MSLPAPPPSSEPDRPKVKRGQQAKCKTCSHPHSFHGHAENACKALGCKCACWVAPVSVPA